jgi:hypothetical protein
VLGIVSYATKQQMMVILTFDIKGRMEAFQKMFGRDHKMIIILNSLLLSFEIKYPKINLIHHKPWLESP